MKKIGIWIAAGIGTIILAFGVIVAVMYGRINSRLDDLKDGFTFEAEYQVILPEEEKTDDVIISIMKQTASLKGTVHGEVDGDILHLELVPEGKENLTIEIYQQDEVALINMKKLYEGYCNEIIERQPLMSTLIPEWSGGVYLSNEQLEEITGMQVGLQMETEGELTALSLAAFEKIPYESGDAEKTYFQLKDIEAVNYNIIIGLDTGKVFEDPVECSLVLQAKDDDVQFKMDVTAMLDENPQLTMPEDVLNEEQVSNLSSVWEIVQSAVEVFEGLQGK